MKPLEANHAHLQFRPFGLLFFSLFLRGLHEECTPALCEQDVEDDLARESFSLLLHSQRRTLCIPPGSLKVAPMKSAVHTHYLGRARVARVLDAQKQVKTAPLLHGKTKRSRVQVGRKPPSSCLF